MVQETEFIWFDGKLVPWAEAQIHVLTHTLHYGMGVFEGVRAYKAEKGTAIFRLQEHTDRLFRSAHILGMEMPFDRDTVNAAQLAAVRENNLESGYIRPMAFYGSEGMGLRADNLKVHCMVAAWAWGAYLGVDGMNRGIRIRVSSFTRHHVNITMCRAKANGNYMNSMLALKEALDGGYDEALLLDSEGYVMEGSGENIFIIRDGVLYTPDLTSALDGITRRTVIQLAEEAGFKVIEKRITRDEVYIADEAFFTGTAAEVTPVRQVDHMVIGEGGAGPGGGVAAEVAPREKAGAAPVRVHVIPVQDLKHLPLPCSGQHLLDGQHEYRRSAGRFQRLKVLPEHRFAANGVNGDTVRAFQRHDRGVLDAGQQAGDALERLARRVEHDVLARAGLHNAVQSRKQLLYELRGVVAHP